LSVSNETDSTGFETASSQSTNDPAYITLGYSKDIFVFSDNSDISIDLTIENNISYDYLSVNVGRTSAITFTNFQSKTHSFSHDPHTLNIYFSVSKNAYNSDVITNFNDATFETVVIYIDIYIDSEVVDTYEQETYGGVNEDSRRNRYQIRRVMEMQEECMAAPCAPKAFEPIPCAKASLSLDDFIKEKDAGFTETLLSLIKKSGMKNSTVYKKANISKQHFSKLINDPDAKPSKPTAIALALALELDLDGTKDLIGRAGYALTNSSTFDLIIRYFIENEHYNVIEINIALYEFDQSLLGA
jgi:hypothetical protein